MIWELYEVWAESEDGTDELVSTTASLKEARKIRADTPNSYILSEDTNGDITEIE